MLSTRISRLLTVSTVSILLAYQVKETTAEVMDAKALSSAVAKFSAKFCNELDKDKSVVSSPLSAEYVLALLALGASDECHSELLQSLGIPDNDSIRSSFKAVSSKLKAIQGVTLNVANKVYIMEGPYELNDQLKADAVDVFDAGFEKMNFSDGAASANTINKWVESKTNNRIKDLLSSDSLDSSTRLVLVNALYFKGTWKKQFDPVMTRPQTFHVTKEKQAKVPMMYKEDTFEYGESSELDAQILKLTYVGDEASMVIVLPRDIEGLDSILNKLASGHDLINEIDKLHRLKVQVSLPKFKIETDIDLNTLLPKLGITEIFKKTNTGLRGLLNPSEALYVSKAVQKAFIEVNEEGAEAAAATAMVILPCSVMVDFNPVPRFIADRPFLTLIVVDGLIYFQATQRAMAMFTCSVRMDRKPVPRFIANRPFLTLIVVDGLIYFQATQRAMTVVGYSAMLDFDPVPEFIADRPFLTVIVVGGVTYFQATQRGDLF